VKIIQKHDTVNGKCEEEKKKPNTGTKNCAPACNCCSSSWGEYGMIWDIDGWCSE